ncbi:hypothetical protein [Streptomyces sp. 11-1-2]|uniref:hypothetical protein n=1 Tax=unclassified Streptomyces TaxID=2593676 RepID=UPI000B8DB47D|nr:hypothetical protein [Streptomyces sp. 11-1-2]ASQ97098.1 hypothetical protein CGL27_32335 [Streptomyces sp. 11-1-2]
MEYQKPEQVTAEKAAEIFGSGQPREISETLIAASLNLQDREWVERWLIHFTSHPDSDVRRAAALALGHLARLHRQVSPDAVEAVGRLRGDESLAGAAADALEDVEIFTRAP